MLRIPRFVLLAAAVALALPAGSSAQQPTRTVAVLDFSAFSMGFEDASAIGKGMAGMMITELSGRPGLKVIERQQIRSLLEEQKLSLSGRVDESTAIQIGKLLGAQYLITGNIALMQKQARVDARIFNVETSEIERAEKLSGRPDAFLDMVVDIADALSANLDLEVPPRGASVEIPIAATLTYSRGLDYEDRGDLEQAVQMYRKALELAPEYAQAKAALERVKKQQGGNR